MAKPARIPKAEITGLSGYLVKRFTRKMLGEVPDGVAIMWQNRPVLMGLSGLGRVRQIAHRAREHVASRRPRVTVSTTEQQRVVARFLKAVRHGDVRGLLDVLAPDVIVVADGGGLAQAARRPVIGAARVAGWLATGLRSLDFEARAVWLNGAPGIRIDVAGQLDTAVSLVVEDGRITHLYAVRNPTKLTRLHDVAPLTRH